MRSHGNAMRRGEHKHGFDRAGLPPAAAYYQPIFGVLRFNASGWAHVCCVFHEDRHASLSIHRDRGAFRCFAYDARGRDALAFEVLRSGTNFKSAARALVDDCSHVSNIPVRFLKINRRKSNV
jgi:CHC2 zinc finger